MKNITWFIYPKNPKIQKLKDNPMEFSVNQRMILKCKECGKFLKFYRAMNFDKCYHCGK